MDCPMKMCDLLSFGSWAVGLIGAVSFVLGVLSALAPGKSIGLYIWVMAKFNWAVRPIDEAREVGNTRFAGFVLIFLGLVIFFNVWKGQCHGVCPIR